MSMAQEVSLACRVLLAAVFAISVLSKVHSRAAWQSYRSWLASLPVAPLRASWAPAAPACAEFAVVVGVAIPLGSGDLAGAGLAAGSALCLALTAGLAIALRRGSWQPCHCFGASSEPLGRQQVLRNALLTVFAITGMLGWAFAGHQRLGTGPAGLAVIGGLSATIVIVFFGDLVAILSPQPGASPAPRPGAG
jgi:hypothetical protein